VPAAPLAELPPELEPPLDADPPVDPDAPVDPAPPLDAEPDPLPAPAPDEPLLADDPDPEPIFAFVNMNESEPLDRVLDAVPEVPVAPDLAEPPSCTQPVKVIVPEP